LGNLTHTIGIINETYNNSRDGGDKMSKQEMRNDLEKELGKETDWNITEALEEVIEQYPLKVLKIIGRVLSGA